MAPRNREGKSNLAAGISRRAGAYLERAYAGPHRNKRIAQDLDCGVHVVKELRRGGAWTALRWAQLTRRFGWDFLGYVFGPLAGDEARYAATVNERIEYLRAELDRLAKELARGPLGAPPPGEGAVGAGGDADGDRGARGEERELADGETWRVTRGRPGKGRTR